jgi:hypothetical protein
MSLQAAFQFIRAMQENQSLQAKLQDLGQPVSGSCCSISVSDVQEYK